MKATKDQLRKEIESLRHVGQQLSNIAYNLSSRNVIDECAKDSMRRTYREWDAIPRSESTNTPAIDKATKKTASRTSSGWSRHRMTEKHRKGKRNAKKQVSRARRRLDKAVIRDNY